MTEQPRLWDVSVAIHTGMVQWDGEELLATAPLSRTPHDVANVTLVTLTTHSGTHVDAPRHFVHDGATVDRVPLDRWIGPCWVADLHGAGPGIEVADLERAGIPVGIERLALKTNNSALWRTAPDTFTRNYTALSVAAAEWIVDRGIRLIGIDYLSIGLFDESGTRTHLALLKRDVVVVEGLDLSDIEPGLYELLCFPLKILDGDGAPARVALRGPLSS